MDNMQHHVSCFVSIYRLLLTLITFDFVTLDNIIHVQFVFKFKCVVLFNYKYKRTRTEMVQLLTDKSFLLVTSLFSETGKNLHSIFQSPVVIRSYKFCIVFASQKNVYHISFFKHIWKTANQVHIVSYASHLVEYKNRLDLSRTFKVIQNVVFALYGFYSLPLKLILPADPVQAFFLRFLSTHTPFINDSNFIVHANMHALEDGRFGKKEC